MSIDHSAALARFDRLASYGGVVRGEWQGHDGEGREIACWLGALDAGVTGVAQCKAAWLPAWLAHLIPDFDDNTSDAAWPGLVARFRAILGALPGLTPEGSRRALLRTLDASLAVAEPRDTRGVVAPVRALLARELSGAAPSQEEWQAEAAAAAAWAARAAAAAAEAATAAAWAARLAAAEEAAWAARAVAWAARAARSGSWDAIAGACFAALEQELGI